MLKAAGFSDTIKPAHWGEEWRQRKHVQLVAPDSSIMEITRGNEYIRIVLLTCTKSPPKPFAVYWFRSKEHPERPKTEFHLSKRAPAYMNSAEVEHVINIVKEGRETSW